MAQLAVQLRHDATSLYQFVSSVADRCERRDASAAYLDSSERFFKYLVDLAEATRKYIQNFSCATPALYLDLRSEIAVLRAGWQSLHARVKPALDGDTLNIPTALIEGLINRFREIPKYSDTDFLIFHTNEFNYLNVRLSIFGGNADRIASLVRGPLFPNKLALIGIPYSQLSSLFMNCLIPHEMGHYVCWDIGLGSKLRPTIESAIVQRLGGTLRPLDRSALVDKVLRWSEELFCDSFAVRLVGFCYSFAFIELFDTSKALDATGNLSQQRSADMTEFDEHPPDLFRVRQQRAILEKDGWWPDLAKVDSQYVALLRAVQRMKDTDFKFSINVAIDTKKVVEAFLSVAPQVLSELDNVTVGLRSGFQSWKDTSAEVEDYLSHGVVPSSLLETPGELKFVYPDTVALLNSSYKFYVESLDTLLGKIKDVSLDDVRARSEWAGKVQTWTAKAIEDVNLLRLNGVH
jgi:hypothetical protein